MYLSRVIVDPMQPATARVLACPYTLHQAVMAGFDPARRGESRVLFRVEPVVAPLSEEDERVWSVILVQSELEPDWPRALQRFFPETPLPVVKPFEPNVCRGEMLRYRLRANPTVRRGGKRLGLVGEDGWLSWLGRKLEAVGAVDEGARATDEGLVRARQRPMLFQSVLYDGALTVRDPVALAEAVREGLGSAKAFGFGLLSLARP